MLSKPSFSTPQSGFTFVSAPAVATAPPADGGSSSVRRARNKPYDPFLRECVFHEFCCVVLGQVSYSADGHQVYALLRELGAAAAVVDLREGPQGTWFVDVSDPAQIHRLLALHRKLLWSFDGTTVVDLRWNQQPPLPETMVKRKDGALAPMTVELARNSSRSF